eukprot:scaffold266166_cov63-Attheya_sp.AAC.1
MQFPQRSNPGISSCSLPHATVPWYLVQYLVRRTSYLVRRTWYRYQGTTVLTYSRVSAYEVRFALATYSRVDLYRFSVAS